MRNDAALGSGTYRREAITTRGRREGVILVGLSHRAAAGWTAARTWRPDRDPPYGTT
ncbi:hypothetical protein GCM10009775_18610 [Microbacterium aoyamense]|uniref:Uncharacterized protein n=1 Tax=Microbacterium aoyamense TaxID=344166 RepID=A0ABN2PPW8_9MICO